MVLVQKWPFFQLVFLGNKGQENVCYDILERKNSFLRYKSKKLKKSKNCHFSKWVNPWFWSQNGHFSNLIFLGNTGKENVFQIFQNEKTPFYALKTSSSKSRKVDIFPKGLTHCFGPKIAICPTLFFLDNIGKKNVFTIFQNEKTPFQAIIIRSSKSHKIDIFSKGLTHGFGPKMTIFSTSFFQSIQANRMSFTIFQNEKAQFQAKKIRSSKSRKIDIFQKALTHGFGPKIAIFPTCVFQEIQAKKLSFSIFQNEKTRFQAIKTRSSKSRNIDIFPKRLTHGFDPKMAICATCFFQTIQARKKSFTIFQNEQTHSRL